MGKPEPIWHRCSLYFSCCRCLVFNYACSFMAAAASWPLVRLSGIHMQPIESTLDFLFWGVLKLGFAVYFEDLTFYWMHRMLHASTWLYARVHKLHHTYTAPIAINGAYMTAAEQNMIVVGILLPMVLMRAHIYVVWAWMFFRNWETCEEHSGYDFPCVRSRRFAFGRSALDVFAF